MKADYIVDVLLYSGFQEVLGVANVYLLTALTSYLVDHTGFSAASIVHALPIFQEI